MRQLLCIGLLAVAVSAPACAGVRKCTDGKGRVTYQDAQCASAGDSVPKPVVPVAAVARSDTKPDVARHIDPQAQGIWHGAAKFRYVSGAPLDAQADADVELALLPDGRVQGFAPSAGCRFEGVHTPYEANRIVAVDITVSGCKDNRFNARYAGQLNAKAVPGQSKLGMHAITAVSPVSADGYRDMSMATIDAALRR
jgi:hypothetical protein